LVLHTQSKRTLEDVEKSDKADQDARYYLHLADLTLRESLKNLQIEESLHNLTRMVGLALKAVRVSIVRCDQGARTGNVLGSSDLRIVRNLNLDLNKYPEILYVLQSQKLLALDNLAKDISMAFVTRQNKSIHFNSMVVAPIRLNSNDVWGVLSARMPENKTSLSDSEIRFVQLVSHVVGLTLLKDRSIAALSPEAKKSA
jgi:GAF domain-containing protein